MKAFTINSFFVCRVTGRVISEYSYQGSDGFTVVHKDFSSEQNAVAHIEKHKRDWFLQCLEKFIHHKRHIIEAANTTEKADALEKCLKALVLYETKSLKTICESFLNGLKYYQAIMPSPGNPSAANSADNLTELIKFCQAEAKPKP